MIMNVWTTECGNPHWLWASEDNGWRIQAGAYSWTGENPNEPSPQENDVDDEEKFHNDHEFHDDDLENEQEEEVFDQAC